MSIRDTLPVYLAARRIAELSFGYWTSNAEPNKPWLTSRLGDRVSPEYYQTTGGLFLVMSAKQGKPSEIWTPWGVWPCWGGGVRNGAAEAGLFSHLKLREHSKRGPEGIVYAVLEVEGKTLPEAVLREQAAFTPVAQAAAEWNAMREQAYAA